MMIISELSGGSSPRVWGQDSMHNNFTFDFGIIPTRVGTSSNAEKMISRDKDHPHACGDKSTHLNVALCIKGSSPRVWGQVKKGKLNFGEVRIIPTRVGTSARSAFSNEPAKDHPHACGDKAVMPSHKQTPLGSSPRVWGQGVVVIALFVPYRIIPTRVGTS